MKKGNFIASLFVLASFVGMFLFYLYLYDINIVTVVSMGVIGLAALFIVFAGLVGINSITSVSKSLKRVRRMIQTIYLKDADSVWNVISEQTFLFKNSALDQDMSNYKREMERIEEDGLVYTQADIRDYIRLDRIYAKVKKSYLDVITYIVMLLAVVGTMALAYVSLGVFTPGIYAHTLTSFIKPILVFDVFMGIILIEYVVFYRASLARVNKEYTLFISDFNKCVMPDAKNDMINNVLYLQQLSIQNMKKSMDEAALEIAATNKELISRQNNSTKELDRHVEGVQNALNRFNEGIEDLKVSMDDQIKNDTLIASNEIKTYKDMLDAFENKVNKIIDKVGNVVESKKNGDEEVVEEELKKTTRKASTKKTTTKKSAKKETEEVKDVEEKAPVKKKRGRKSKAEKEAELQAALAKAAKDAEKIAKATIIEEEASNEASVEETEEKVEVIETPVEEIEEKVEVMEMPVEETEEKVEVMETPVEEIEEKVEVIETPVEEENEIEG